MEIFLFCSRSTGNSFEITGFSEAKHGNFQKKKIFENMSYEHFVNTTCMLIRCHIKTDYYQKEIHFDSNRRKKIVPIENRTPELSV